MPGRGSRRRRQDGPKCLAHTARRGRCQNPKGSCPHHNHGQQEDPPVAAAASSASQRPAANTASLRPAASSGSLGLMTAMTSSPRGGSAAGTGPGALWPGVAARTGGRLCDNVADFGGVLNAAFDRFAVDEDSIVRDYHMCRTLRVLFAQHPPGAQFEDRYDDHKHRPVSNPVGSLVFTGGSSLTNAYQLADRISEDIDLSIALTAEPEAKNALSRIRRLAVIDTARACSPDLPDTAHNTRTTGGDVGRRVITVGDTPDYLVAESSIIRPFDEDLQTELDTACHRPFAVARVASCQSLMGRAADPATVAAYPELAAFDVPVLCVPFTAANKFFALHKRAMAKPDHDALEQLQKRGRDIYDLWSIAESPVHAAETRAALPILARHIQAKGATKEPHPRPDEGFSTSPAFQPGTPQYGALKAAYDNILDLVWGRKPASFADAVAAIKTLD